MLISVFAWVIFLALFPYIMLTITRSKMKNGRVYWFAPAILTNTLALCILLSNSKVISPDAYKYIVYSSVMQSIAFIMLCRIVYQQMKYQMISISKEQKETLEDKLSTIAINVSNLLSYMCIWQFIATIMILSVALGLFFIDN
jgi:hypothetical protein